MRKLVLFCVLIISFLFLSSLPVNAVADCPVCPSGYSWIIDAGKCQEGPPGKQWPKIVDPIYVDCGNCKCDPGKGCQAPCTFPPHPGLYTCFWLPQDDACRPSSKCTSGYQSGGECERFGQNECGTAGPFVCLATTTPQPGVSCDICGCQNGAKTTTCPNCNPECYNCVYKEGKSWTAFRCLPTNDPQEFIVWLLKSVIGIAGGIAFLLMLWGGFQIITSTGDPEKLNKGKEILTSAIIGLVIIIFSLFLLQLIGVKILQIPGFGTP